MDRVIAIGRATFHESDIANRCLLINVPLNAVGLTSRKMCIAVVLEHFNPPLPSENYNLSGATWM